MPPPPHWIHHTPPTLDTLTDRLRQRHRLVHTLYVTYAPPLGASTSQASTKTAGGDQAFQRDLTRLKRVDTDIGTGKLEHASLRKADLDRRYAEDPLGGGRVRVVPKGLRVGTSQGRARLWKALGEWMHRGDRVTHPSPSTASSSSARTPMSPSEPPARASATAPKSLAEWARILDTLWTSSERIFEHFVDGQSVEWIARTRQLRPSTVRSYIRSEAAHHRASLVGPDDWRRWLESLHRAHRAHIVGVDGWMEQLRERLWVWGYDAPWRMVMGVSGGESGGESGESGESGYSGKMAGGYEGWRMVREEWWRGLLSPSLIAPS